MKKKKKNEMKNEKNKFFCPAKMIKIQPNKRGNVDKLYNKVKILKF